MKSGDIIGEQIRVSVLVDVLTHLFTILVMFLPTNAIFKTHLRVHVDILAHLIDELSAAPLLSGFLLIFRDDSAVTRAFFPLITQCH